VIRRLFYVLGALLLVMVLGAAGVYWFLSGDGVRVALEQQASAWLGQPVRIGHATASLFPRVAVRLEEVTAGDPVGLRLSRVDLSTGLRALLSRRIDDAEVIVSGSRIEMPLPFGFPTQAPSASASVAAGAASGVEVVSIRAIALRDVTIAGRGREIGLSADSALAGTRLTITSLTARSRDTVLEARGQIDLAPRVAATITATANQLDLDDLLTLAGAFTAERPETTRATPPAQITATVTAPRGRLADVPIGRIEASLLADGSDLRIEPLKFDVFGGRYDGWLDVSFGEMLDVRVGVGVANLDVAQLAAYGGAADTITGRLFGSGRFGARGRDVGEILPAVRGVGEVSLADGAIRHLDVVRTVLLFFGRPDAQAPPPAGEKYTSLTATFALADRTVRSDDFTLRSPDFDVFARGTLALPTKALAARGELVVSEALSAQAGRDLYRYTQAHSRIVLPATISGTLARPRVGIDAGAAVRRGLQNEVQRRLRDLFERFRPKEP
jgi:uncharacterized protein involved in outer membrane biogenesis